MSLEDDVRELKRQLSELARNCEGLPVRITSGVGGGDGTSGKRTSILQVRDGFSIPAREGTTPGSSSQVDKIAGDDPVGEIKNWSTVVIGAGTYLITMQVDEQDIIVNAFC